MVDLESRGNDTSIGLLLKEMLDEQRKTNDNLHGEVKDVKERVSSTEQAVTIMTAAVEQINSTLREFSDSVKETQKAQTQHWHNQDKLFNKFESMLEIMNKHDAEIKEIKDKQINGCPNFKNFEARRDIEVKHFHEVKDYLKTAVSKNREEIDELQQECTTQKEKVTVANNRIADLETYQKENEKWKMGIYITITSKAIVIAIFFYMLWHGGMK